MLSAYLPLDELYVDFIQPVPTLYFEDLKGHRTAAGRCWSENIPTTVSSATSLMNGMRANPYPRQQ